VCDLTGLRRKTGCDHPISCSDEKIKMSYMRAPNHGPPSYMNGTASANSGSRLGRFDLDPTPDTSADERSRSRGAYNDHVGPSDSQQPHPSTAMHGPVRIDRQRANRRSRDYEWSASRSRSRGVAVRSRYGAAGGHVEEMLGHISQQWAPMASDACIPVKVALQLMDPSSLGLQEHYESFCVTHAELQNVLKGIVNEHHQGFNSSIGTFHKIQSAIHASQQRVRTLRAGLVQAKGSLSAAKPELRAIAMSSRAYASMLHALADIERLQALPERLETQVTEKRFLGAVATLQEALAVIRTPEMDEIGALADLRVYLSNQEHSLTDILIEELHSHLYLKSPYCEERWKAHSHRHAAPSIVAADDERAMFAFLDLYDGSKAMQEDTSRNPEANTFEYIQLLIESLHSLGKLDIAIDAIDHRMPVELFKVVERSHSEVEQRHPSTMGAVAARHRQQHSALGESGTLMREGGVDAERKATLEDLLTTLYAKFEAIAEGHRVLHEVVIAIAKRETYAPEETAQMCRSFRELWQVLQSEIRSLLHDHLASNDSLGRGQRTKDAHSGANIFRLVPRDRARRLFKMSELDAKGTAIATEKEDLEFILKSSVPGLVHPEAGHAQAARDEEAAALRLADRSATGHKLLVEPNVFNMGVLLPPSLAFLHRLQAIVPPASAAGVGARSLTAFLDDFLLNVFYPQLEETLLELCGRLGVNHPDAFQPDPEWRRHSARPVFKGTIRFYAVLEMVSTMLAALPHEQSFSQLVIGQMRAYYDRCFSWSKALLQRTMASEDGPAGVKMRLAAELAHDTEVNSCVIGLLNLHKGDKEGTSEGAQTAGKVKDEAALVLAEKESALLIQLVKSRKIEDADVVNDRKALAALATLHTSMKWLAAKCRRLRYVSPRALDMADGEEEKHAEGGRGKPNTHRRRWTATNPLDHPAPNGPYLPLDTTTAQQFDAVVDSFREVDLLILRTLHLDIRLHLLRGIYVAMDQSYLLGSSTQSNDPDPAILSLTDSLTTVYAASLLPTLPTSSYDFITTDLSILAGNAFTALVGCVQGPRMDGAGLGRMGTNILVLQQSLKGGWLEVAADLGRAARFWGLGVAGVSEVVEKGVKEGFENGEVKALVRLCWIPERDARNGSVEEWVERVG